MPSIPDSAWKRLVELEPFPQPPLIRTRHPVVLMHGFGLFASMRRGGHLHREAMHLRSHGVTAYAPNVAAYNTVTARSAMWKRRLERVLQETGAEQLNLIAQSMGGLDARYLISRLGMHESVASLVTIAAPHHGSCVAEIVLEQPERVRQWTADVLNRMGAASLEDAASDFLHAVRELTPARVTNEFNPAVPDHPSVRYFSYAARAGQGTDVPINPLLVLLNRMVYRREGINDGFVCVDSAKWGEVLGVIDADHVQQVGISLRRSGFDADAFYAKIVEHLASEGF